MGEPLTVGESTADERHVIALLRHGSQSLQGLAETLGLTPSRPSTSYSVSPAPLGSCPSSAITRSATGWQSKSGYSMNLIHGFDHHNVLDWLIPTTYITYQVVGQSNRTQQKMAVLKISRRSRCTPMDIPPYGERISVSAAPQVGGAGTSR